MRSSDFQTARQQKNLVARENALALIESCDYLLALPNMAKASIFAVSAIDGVAATHLHRFVRSWGGTVIETSGYLTISTLGWRPWDGVTAEKNIRAARARATRRAETLRAEIDRAAVRYGLPETLPHAIDVVA